MDDASTPFEGRGCRPRPSSIARLKRRREAILLPIRGRADCYHFATNPRGIERIQADLLFKIARRCMRLGHAGSSSFCPRASCKSVYAGSIPTPASISFPSIAEPLDCLRHCDEARVAELVDATDLKLCGCRLG
jgi:hypothetical protein